MRFRPRSSSAFASKVSLQYLSSSLGWFSMLPLCSRPACPCLRDFGPLSRTLLWKHASTPVSRSGRAFLSLSLILLSSSTYYAPPSSTLHARLLPHTLKADAQTACQHGQRTSITETTFCARTFSGLPLHD